jgi:hypothetical protein
MGQLRGKRAEAVEGHSSDCLSKRGRLEGSIEADCRLEQVDKAMSTVGEHIGDKDIGELFGRARNNED